MKADELRARKLVAERAGGAFGLPTPCEGCDRAQATDWSHRVARGRGGQWCPSNGMALCRPCHQWATAYPADAEVSGWIVPTGIAPETVPCFMAYRGWVLLLKDGTLVRLGLRPTIGHHRRETARRGDLARRELSR